VCSFLISDRFNLLTALPNLNSTVSLSTMTYRGVRRIGDKGTGSRRRFVFSLSPRGTSGERAGERGKP
jgi:hypothetical protein